MAQHVLRLDLDLLDSLGRRFEPEAMVYQEDRNLIMSASRVIDAEDDRSSVEEAAKGFQAPLLGNFLLVGPRKESPRWIYRAVVHDLEESPTCRTGSVRRCLASILADVSHRGLRTLATEPLGLWRRSGLDMEEMITALDEAVFEALGALEGQLRLTLLLKDLESLEEASRLLRASLLRRAHRSFHTVEETGAVVEAQSRGHRFQFRFVPGALSGYLVTRSSHIP